MSYLCFYASGYVYSPIYIALYVQPYLYSPIYGYIDKVSHNTSVE